MFSVHPLGLSCAHIAHMAQVSGLGTRHGLEHFVPPAPTSLPTPWLCNPVQNDSENPHAANMRKLTHRVHIEYPLFHHSMRTQLHLATHSVKDAMPIDGPHLHLRPVVQPYACAVRCVPDLRGPTPTLTYPTLVCTYTCSPFGVGGAFPLACSLPVGGAISWQPLTSRWQCCPPLGATGHAKYRMPIDIELPSTFIPAVLGGHVGSSLRSHLGSPLDRCQRLLILIPCEPRPVLITT